MKDFKNIEYLKSGNDRQKRAYLELKELKIFELLKKFNPILTGTVPIDIDLPESDLDIICECQDHIEFKAMLFKLFATKSSFTLKSNSYNNVECSIAKFKTEHFEIEIFGQSISTEKQSAYRHMLIEYEILNKRGNKFKEEIKRLKSEGFKTEPAFAKLLELKGDPYKKLLKYKI